MKQWAVRHTTGAEETETLLNDLEEKGWSVYYVGYSNESCRFITWLNKEKEQCSTIDTPSVPEASSS